MAIQLLGMPTTLGLPRRATLHGPEALRSAGLVRNLRRMGLQVEDLGDLPLPDGSGALPAGERVAEVVRAARQQSDLWLSRHREGSFMLTLGGDHSASLGTLWALQRMGRPFDVVWIDAHGDYNVLETSPSGNPHGMVLAMAAGLMPGAMERIVQPEQLHLMGIRDLDRGERQLLFREGVRVYSPEQVRSRWEELIGQLGHNVYLSFDIDSVDPAEAPGTMTPVPGGFSRQEALELVSEIARRRRIVALDIVEFHPDLDQGDQTLNLALAVARQAMGAPQRHRSEASGAVGE